MNMQVRGYFNPDHWVGQGLLADPLTNNQPYPDHDIQVRVGLVRVDLDLLVRVP